MTDAVDGTAPELIDADLFARSLTGFDEVAIAQYFRVKLTKLAEDETSFMRALLFVKARRDGSSDQDAFRAAMTATVEDVVGRFAQEQVTEDLDEDAQAERDAAYADFVVGVGVSFMPEQYNALTLGQRAALLEAANRRRR